MTSAAFGTFAPALTFASEARHDAQQGATASRRPLTRGGSSRETKQGRRRSCRCWKEAHAHNFFSAPHQLRVSSESVQSELVSEAIGVEGTNHTLLVSSSSTGYASDSSSVVRASKKLHAASRATSRARNSNGSTAKRETGCYSEASPEIVVWPSHFIERNTDERPSLSSLHLSKKTKVLMIFMFCLFSVFCSATYRVLTEDVCFLTSPAESADQETCASS